MVLAIPESMLVAVMLTFGSDAPAGSVTVPTIVACCANATVDTPHTVIRTMSIHRNVARFCGEEQTLTRRILAKSKHKFILFSRVLFGIRLKSRHPMLQSAWISDY